MQEFAFVSAPSSEPATLVARLNEKSAEGWSVVAIVAGAVGETTAYLCREASSAAAISAAVTSVGSAAEPGGWASSPDTSSAPTAGRPASSAEPQLATAASASTSAASQMAVSSVPAQWAADPTGRYELRYWDGIRWTEHVSRAGQQYTDPL